MPIDTEEQTFSYEWADRLRSKQVPTEDHKTCSNTNKLNRYASMNSHRMAQDARLATKSRM